MVRTVDRNTLHKSCRQGWHSNQVSLSEVSIHWNLSNAIIYAKTSGFKGSFTFQLNCANVLFFFKIVGWAYDKLMMKYIHLKSSIFCRILMTSLFVGIIIQAITYIVLDGLIYDMLFWHCKILMSLSATRLRHGSTLLSVC